jgi:uncharacterized protein YbaR (Trm112 family)
MLGKIGHPEKSFVKRRIPIHHNKRGKDSAPMIDPELLQLLACPENHTPLQVASKDLIGRLNQAIASGVVKDRGGEPVQAPIEGGLVREDGTVLYPIIDAVPVMLVDRGISLQGIPSPDEQNR